MPHRRVKRGNHTQHPPRGYLIEKTPDGLYIACRRPDADSLSTVPTPIEIHNGTITVRGARWRAVEACHRHAHQHAPLQLTCQEGDHRACTAAAWQCKCPCHPVGRGD